DTPATAHPTAAAIGAICAIRAGNGGVRSISALAAGTARASVAAVAAHTTEAQDPAAVTADTPGTAEPAVVSAAAILARADIFSVFALFPVLAVATLATGTAVAPQGKSRGVAAVPAGATRTFVAGRVGPFATFAAGATVTGEEASAPTVAAYPTGTALAARAAGPEKNCRATVASRTLGITTLATHTAVAVQQTALATLASRGHSVSRTTSTTGADQPGVAAIAAGTVR
ncbi:hypothetical protein, partial [Mycolicibacterium sphagni]|uniref:hypothetical protein n=1 Tax=Mycolicibacterium sphagni TaxID=1786 RepID=UPI003B3AFC0C